MKMKRVCFVLFLALVSVSAVKSEFHFSSPLVEVDVPEESSNVKDLVTLTLTSEVKSKRFELMSLVDSRSQDLFEIDPDLGVISAVAPLDREFMDKHYFKVRIKKKASK